MKLLDAMDRFNVTVNTVYGHIEYMPETQMYDVVRHQKGAEDKIIAQTMTLEEAIDKLLGK